MTNIDSPEQFHMYVEQVGLNLDADVFFYNGIIGRPSEDAVTEQCNQRRNRRPNVFLVLTTMGGDPSAAYQIARTLQHHYKKITAFVPGYCKSAGTLVLLGAHELVMSVHSELGPLDVQVLRPDEVGERSSSLTPFDALRSLETQAAGAFERIFKSLRSDLLMTTKLSAEIATNLIASLYGEIFAQIDPMRLGELDRSTRIIMEYGTRLISHSNNVKPGALVRLIHGYPSHGFVIDTKEALELFLRVRVPTESENALGTVRRPIHADIPYFGFINKEVATTEDEDGNRHGGATPGTGVGTVPSVASPGPGSVAEPSTGVPGPDPSAHT